MLKSRQMFRRTVVVHVGTVTILCMLRCFSHVRLCATLWIQSCPTVCDPMDYSLTGSSVHGILQARILEWVPMAFSRVSSQPRDWTHISLHLLHWQADSLLLVPPGKGLLLGRLAVGEADWAQLLQVRIYSHKAG